MCPQYTADPTKDSAGFEVFPKGEYVLKIGEPKAFERKGDKGVNFGIRFPCTIVEGQFKDKKSIVNIYQHTQEAKDFGKQFLLAAAGYTKKQEDDFNQAAAGADWSFNTDTGAVGAAWRQYMGLHVVAGYSVKKQENSDQEQQQTDYFRPYVAEGAAVGNSAQPATVGA